MARWLDKQRTNKQYRRQNGDTTPETEEIKQVIKIKYDE